MQPPSRSEARMGWIQTAGMVMLGAGVLIGGISYAYDVYKRNQASETKPEPAE